MTVEDQMNENAVSLDRFPIGMRVLAVDDDPTCLKVLETLLRKCQYQVTVTNQAIKALQMLRENRNMFDLVISDVNMPDIDGFKLLELVGLEMDLPVIMLSAHSDTQLVMKGVTHGACDYLLKPVRIEEIKNIWQHVVRRKNPNPKSQSRDVARLESGGGAGPTGALEQGARHNKKRKDKEEDEEGESEDEDGPENDDLAAQKRSRVVWTPELHKKFIDAIMHLGYEKAFPKKILDFMNVEGLTRENVASHLQKFRQLLKKAVAEDRQKENGALGIKDLSYMRMSLLNHNEFGDSRSLTQSQRLSSPSVSHRLNSPRGLTIRGLTPPPPPPPSAGKFPPPNQTQTTLFQGFPPSLELNRFQAKSSSNPLGELSNAAPGLGFSGLTGFQVAGTTTFGGSSGFMDRYRRNEPWHSTVQSSSVIPLTASSLFGGGGGSSSATLVDDSRDGLIGNIVSANNNNNFVTRQTWEGGFNISNNNANQNFGAFNSQSLDQRSNTSIFDPIGGGCSSSVFPPNEIERSATETTTVKPSGLGLLGQGKPQDGLITNSCDSLDDILNSLIKRDQSDTLMSGEFGFDNFPLGSCM